MTQETLHFQAEVSRLLDIVAHSLYSDREIFLRELISNASDACDRLRYGAITQPELAAEDPEFRVRIETNADAGTLTITDNGIGMTREELVSNLGTIARSGSLDFVNRLTGDARKDLQLIGQFGVGFYSTFMVADQVDVFTRKAGETASWHWSSSGQGAFSIEEAADQPRGTRVVLTLKEDAKEFLEEARIRTIVRKYSDHIAIPVDFAGAEKTETLNSASALWTRAKSEITEEQYKEFYHHVSHGFDDPWLTLHWRAEGKIEYAALLFIPSMKPFDLFDPQRAHRVKLYVKRVFITEGAEGLLPPYLRFVRGVVDSEDLPLNVSREMLQNNPVVARIRAGLVRRILSELSKRAAPPSPTDEVDADMPEASAADADDSAPDTYTSFWTNFGAVLKEGLYEDAENRQTLLTLARFRSTASDGLVSLADYIGRMKPGQDAIYFITGEDERALLKSPHLEGFRAKGVEVLLLTDTIDEFWVPTVGTYEGKSFKSVTRGGADLGKIETSADTKPASEEETPPASETASLIAFFKSTLGDTVKDVRPSDRLTESPVCLVADEGDLDIHLERLLKQHNQLGDIATKRVLEINPTHPLVRTLGRVVKAGSAPGRAADVAWLMLDQARILEGQPLTDAQAFSGRLAAALQLALPSEAGGAPATSAPAEEPA